MSVNLGLYALNDKELADKLQTIELLCSIGLQGPVVVSMGVRRCPYSGTNRPVIVIRGTEGVHVLVLTEDRAA